MKFGGFYEHQLPRPWTKESEHTLLKHALDEVELSDRSGFDYIWATEHHFLEEYAHSSAPEVFLAACSQRTKNVRIGHGIMQMPPYINHPARVAERIATLDLLSDGRVEYGIGAGASEAELGGYNVPQAVKKDMMLEGARAVVEMLTQEPFPGIDGKYVKMPARNVVPKPLQKPHPPMWMACSNRPSILQAARLGLGALTFSFIDPGQARQWVADYYETFEKECVPLGYAVNPNIAIACPFLCDRNEARAADKSPRRATVSSSTRWGTTASSASTSRPRPISGTSSRIIPKNSRCRKDALWMASARRSNSHSGCASSRTPGSTR